MLEMLSRFMPPEGIKIVLVLFLSFLLGLEREEHHAKQGRTSFGGVRTFPLIGLLGYTVARLAGPELILLAIGFAVVGAFLLVAYWHKIHSSQEAGVTTEISGLGAFLLGALVSHEQYWIAIALVVASLLVLELKTGLEGLARRIPSDEIITFTKFLLLAAVILPVVPNTDLTPFLINPFKTWLIVVAVSAISYASYILQKAAKEKGGGVLLAALLGGAYSSTATTIVMAKQSKVSCRAHRYSGAILLACGVMYIRMGIFIALFNPTLAQAVAWRLLLVAAAGILGGWAWARHCTGTPGQEPETAAAQNPLELKAAFLFAGLFVVLLVATRFVAQSMGTGGLYALAMLVGVTDITPFVLGVTDAAGKATPMGTAAAAIILAMASNNVVNGVYAFYLGDKRTGRMALGLLAALGALAAILAFLP